MRAGNRRGAFHGVGQPDVQRKLRRFTAGSNEQKQRGRSDNRITDGKVAAAGQVRDLRKSQRSQIPGDEKHPQQKSSVADAIDDERLVARVGGRLAVEIETDQKIRTQAHAFPADKHEHIVVGEDKRQHGEHEEVEVAEEAVVAAFMRHVSRGINVDQHADAGDEQQPDAGKRIEQEAGVGTETRQTCRPA